MGKTPEQCLEAGLKTMQERAAQHGGTHTFQMFSAVMQGLFPNGITANSKEDWEVLGLIQMIVHKLCRLSNGVSTGSWNPENPHDLGNYAFILESVMRSDRKEEVDGIVDICTVCNGPIGPDEERLPSSKPERWFHRRYFQCTYPG